MDNWRDEVTALRARLAVQHLALRAMVMSHPNPAAMLSAWRNLQADSVTAAYAPQGDPRSSEWLTMQVQALAQEWTAEIHDTATLGATADQRVAVGRKAASDVLASPIAPRMPPP